MNKKLAAKLFIVIGLLFISHGLYLIKVRNSPVSNKNSSIAQISAENSQPIKIKINSLNLDIPITSAKLEDGKWPASKDSVSYWVDSPLPGENGNSVIYGHNWPNLFGSLKNIKTGEIINVQFSNSDEKQFKIVETYTVTPDQIHILEPTEDKRLTIYTCGGFLDSKRFVVIAVPFNN